MPLTYAYTRGARTNMQKLYIKAAHVVLQGDGGGLPLKLDFMTLILQKELNNYFGLSDHDEFPDHRRNLLWISLIRFLRHFQK